MKAELVAVNETRKNLSVEVPSEVVDAEIDRVARDYSKRAKVPGFRPGKVPARVIKARFRDQILHDVAHDLVPRAVDEALREQGLEPVSTPDIREVVVEEGRALTFTATFDTLPPFDLGDLGGVALRKPSVAIDEDAVAQAMERLRQRAARFDPVEGRGIVEGDIVTVDIERRDAAGEVDTHRDVAVELGAAANPPGFDAQLLGLEPGATKSFAITFPQDYASAELAGSEVSYTVNVKNIRRRLLPELDDEFAKDMGEFENIDALRARVRADLEHEAQHAAERDMRGDLMKQLASRIPFALPDSLVDREIDRRLEEFAGRLMQQNIDPRQAGIDWNAFRDSQRDAAKEAVGGALFLDELSRKEHIDVSEAEIEQELARYAERTGRTTAAVRSGLEKEGGLSRVYAGLRREKSIDFVMARATIASE